MTEQQLADHILEVLKVSDGPLKAREIARITSQGSSTIVEVSTVNALLYGPLLNRKVVKDMEFRWALKNDSEIKNQSVDDGVKNNATFGNADEQSKEISAVDRKEQAEGLPTETSPVTTAQEKISVKPPTPLKARLTKVFEFLKALHELKNPVPRSLDGEDYFELRKWPKHECIQVREGDFADTDPSAIEAAQYPIRVKRAPLTSCPRPPKEITDWLHAGWEDCFNNVDVAVAKNMVGSNGQTTTEKFSASPQRVKALDSWRIVRGAWAETERPAVRARSVFDELYSMWSRLQKESGRVELALADGFVDIPTASICYPILSRRVELELEANIPEIRVVPAGDRAELFSALLLHAPEVEPAGIARVKKRLDNVPVDPLGGSSTSEFLREAAQGLWSSGEFALTREKRPATQGPAIWRNPVLFVRKKVAGLSSALDNIIQDLLSADSVPPVGLARIVGFDGHADSTGSVNSEETVGNTSRNATPVDTLFSKPANAEQFQISAKLATNGAVLVQGPPGTGKTHTIANLLGDLLAQGKTVLVTAHTTKALRVLRDKVSPPLQPLCLSVLESEAESKNQLSRSAQDIVAKLSTCDAKVLRQEVAELRKKRRSLLASIEEVRIKLRAVRESEIAEIVINGESVRPLDAAKEVKAGEKNIDWIQGPILRESSPLRDDEVRELFSLNSGLSPEDAAELAQPRPQTSRLISPSDFARLAAERQGAAVRSAKHRPEFWGSRAESDSAPEALRKLHENIRKAAQFLAEAESWEREILYCGWTGGALAEGWTDLVKAIEAINLESGEVSRIAMTLLPQLPATIPAGEVAGHLDGIIRHLESGGTLGLLSKFRNRQWHEVIDQSKTEGRPPKKIEDFRHLKRIADFSQSQNLLRVRWERSIAKYSGPTFESLGQAPERTAKIYIAKINYCVAWRSTFWEPVMSEFETCGFRWHDWLEAHEVEPGDYAELTRVCAACSTSLVEVVEAQAARQLERELQAKSVQQAFHLQSYRLSALAEALLSAQNNWDPIIYAEAFDELTRLERLEPSYARRKDLLQRVAQAAPNWAANIADRVGVHSAPIPPGPVAPAWRRQLLAQELEHRAAQTTADLQERMRSMEDELRNTTAEIIEKSTWAAQRDRTGLRQQQALQGYVQMINKVTKTGRGKRDAELMQAARTSLNEARGAVPVWIMPLHRVYESFDPQTTKFDVVIVDEASQSDVSALAALYLGKEHIVVGDKEQVTPDAVGQVVDDVSRLIASHLQGIPNGTLYDGQMSIYDLAETAFGGVVPLREHFRCVPEIIQFSNNLSYNGRILPLREPSSARVRPALVPYRVSGFRINDGKTNEVEAEAIVSLVSACLEHPAYLTNELGDPTSFGVISLLGGEQAELIDRLLRLALSPVTYSRHNILCGTAANLQGDERDIVFLSVVDGPPESGLHATRAAGARDIYKKRYNVAVSRARNQLWVVHSLDPQLHLSAADLRRQLIDHARDPSALMRRMEDKTRRTESEFERLVLERLIRAGYRTATQWKVGSFRIDIVVEGAAGKKLAVECDGERWHTAAELASDLERQAILERLGWIFCRIRGSVFFRNADEAMRPVFIKLTSMGIEPLGEEGIVEDTAATELIEQIKKRAEEIRSIRAASLPKAPDV